MKPHLSLMAACCLTIGIGLVAGCSGGSPKEERTYPIHGTVVEVVDGQLKIDHAAIPGYMGAMQMTFPVSRSELLQGLKAGDHVQGQLQVTGGQPMITQLGKN
jgi:Cu/Ag efflux protein CusF